LKKVLYVATVASHICQFHLPYLEMFQSMGYETHVAARDNLAEKNGLSLNFTDKYFDIPFQRSPKDKRNIKAYKELKKVIDCNKYDFIVCNTPMGGVLTRIAARKARKNGARVIYIAHGFHFYKGAPKKYWLTFFPIEKMFAKLCDMVITINEEDYICAKKHFKTDVRHIHGIGVKTERYYPVDALTKKELRTALSLTDDNFVILCTGELNKNKNQEQLIKAANILKNKISGLKILFAGNGPNEEKLRKLITDLNLNDNIKLLGYRTDLEKIVPAVDLIVSCSRREGLGLNVIEGMLCKKTVVATKNRGHCELIKNDFNGYLVSIGNFEEMADCIYNIYFDIEKANLFAKNSKELAQNYTVNYVKEELTNILGLKKE